MIRAQSRLTVITGPTRSGKSRFAESLATRTKRPVIYVATAERDSNDAEWSVRIADHRARRPAHWTTIETSVDDVDLATLVAEASIESVVLIESLGTWLAAIASEFVAASGGADVDTVALEREMREQSRALVDAISVTAADTIVVSEQTGWGVVSAYPSARIFSSVLGRLTTTLARRAARSYLVVSGFAIDLHAGATLLDIDENM